MYNTVTESSDDTDLGSGGLLLIPDQFDSSGALKKLIAVAGKDSNLYIGDRLNGLGGYDPTNDSTLYQQLSGALPNGVWSNPAYFNNTLYFGSVGNAVRAFPITNAIVASQPGSITPDVYPYPGANPSISAYGASNGILWAIANSSSAALFAYNANNLADKVYDSTTEQWHKSELVLRQSGQWLLSDPEHFQRPVPDRHQWRIGRRYAAGTAGPHLRRLAAVAAGRLRERVRHSEQGDQPGH